MQILYCGSSFICAGDNHVYFMYKYIRFFFVCRHHKCMLKNMNFYLGKRAQRFGSSSNTNLQYTIFDIDTFSSVCVTMVYTYLCDMVSYCKLQPWMVITFRLPFYTLKRCDDTLSHMCRISYIQKSVYGTHYIMTEMWSWIFIVVISDKDLCEKGICALACFLNDVNICERTEKCYRFLLGYVYEIYKTYEKYLFIEVIVKHK